MMADYHFKKVKMHIIRAVIFAECTYGYLYIGLYDSENDRYELYGKIDIGLELRDSLDLIEIPWIPYEEEPCDRKFMRMMSPNSYADFDAKCKREGKHVTIKGQPVDTITNKRPMRWLKPEVILEIKSEKIEKAWGMCDYYFNNGNWDELIRVYPHTGKGHVTTLREMKLMEDIDNMSKQ